jgi:hypothetical protein
MIYKADKQKTLSSFFLPSGFVKQNKQGRWIISSNDVVILKQNRQEGREGERESTNTQKHKECRRRTLFVLPFS